MTVTMTLGLLCLVVPICGKYAGIENRKYLRIVGISGLFFLLSAVFGDGIWMHAALTKIGHMCMMGSYFLGFLGLLIGTLMGALDVVFETDTA